MDYIVKNSYLKFSSKYDLCVVIFRWLEYPVQGKKYWILQKYTFENSYYVNSECKHAS